VFRIKPDDENLASLLEMHFSRSREPLMFQRYEPAVRKGDKRIILVDGEPMGVVNRVPAAGEARSNMHVGGRPRNANSPPRSRDLRGDRPTLREQGLIFVGIDVIGDWLTEINVTRRRVSRRSTGSTASTSKRQSGAGSRPRSRRKRAILSGHCHMYASKFTTKARRRVLRDFVVSW